MSRPYDFSWTTRVQARLRQHCVCAHCGDHLDETYEHAHHVVPNQTGTPGNPAHQWIKSVDNCVVLCEACHDRVHEDGHFRNGAVAPAEYFTHSHGDNSLAHQQWVIQLNLQATRVWPR